MKSEAVFMCLMILLWIAIVGYIGNDEIKKDAEIDRLHDIINMNQEMSESKLLECRNASGKNQILVYDMNRSMERLKDHVSNVCDRLRKTLYTYLTRQRLTEVIAVKTESATYPDDASDNVGMIEKINNT